MADLIRYALLPGPGYSRTYAQSARALALPELAALARRMEAPVSDIAEGDITGTPCLTFSAPALSDGDRQALGWLSCFYVLFAREGELLRPLTVPDGRSFPDSLNGILKYSGKTNEQFTRLLTNLAWAACRTGAARPRLLDPLAGKGTTLFEGLIRGWDVTGVELNATWWREAEGYLTRFLKQGRYKHKAAADSRSDGQGRRLARGWSVALASTREDWESDRAQHCHFWQADTRQLHHFIKKHSHDILVADLPYGVQHAGQGGGTKPLSPAALLKAALPAWHGALKPGAGVALSYNEYTVSREELLALLPQHGFTVLTDPPFTGYRHRVDLGITRDVVVAVRDGGEHSNPEG